MRNSYKDSRLRAERFQEAKRLIAGSKRVIEKTKEQLRLADRVLRNNPNALHPEAASEHGASRETDNQRENRNLTSLNVEVRVPPSNGIGDILRWGIVRKTTSVLVADTCRLRREVRAHRIALQEMRESTLRARQNLINHFVSHCVDGD